MSSASISNDLYPPLYLGTVTDHLVETPQMINTHLITLQSIVTAEHFLTLHFIELVTLIEEFYWNNSLVCCQTWRL